jgi:hypothetical protein
VAILGPEVRFSLHTESRAEARRRASATQVALEQVYDVLRSEAPLGPARNILGAYLDQARNRAVGIALPPATPAELEMAVSAVGGRVEPLDSSAGIRVPLEQVEYLLRREQPHGEVNQIAVELLSLGSQISREKCRSPAERVKNLVFLANSLAAASANFSSDRVASVEAVRTMIRDELARGLSQ